MTTTVGRDNSRLKRFPISGLSLLTIFRTGDEIHARVLSGFPADAMIVRQYYDRETHNYFLVVQSETFAPVKDGDQIPWASINIAHCPMPKEKSKEKNEDGNEGAQEGKAANGESQADVSAESQPGAGG